MGIVFSRSVLRWLSIALVALCAAGTALAGDAGRVAKPNIVIEKGDKCVAPTDVMRREHMNMLKHQRDLTMHHGIRTKQHSLKECIDCHANSRNGSVIGSRDNFCQACHAYVAVTLDCFECHSNKPQPKVAKTETDGVKNARSGSKE
jgi:hypothetical protein